MDIKLGIAVPIYLDDPGDPQRWIIRGCTVLNKNGEEVATIPANVQRPLEQAAVVIAFHEAHYGYPGFRDRPEGRPETHRVEFLLGRVLADAVSVMARAYIEWCNGGLKNETKSEYVDLIAQLHDIWYASRFGSFDGERQVIEPYFAPRISFAAAAQRYGMLELQMRFPDVSDTTLEEMLCWPLDLLRDTLNRLSPQRHPL